jgi:hypothetical protein
MHHPWILATGCFVLGFLTLVGIVAFCIWWEERGYFVVKGKPHPEKDSDIQPVESIAAYLTIAGCAAHYVPRGSTFVVTRKGMTLHPGVAICVRPGADGEDWRKAAELALQHRL